MRAVLFISLVCGILISCHKNSDVQPQLLIGKWTPTYEVFDDKTQQWQFIQTYQMMPDLEFTTDGSFKIGNRPAAENDCCGYIGNKFQIKDNSILFSEFRPPCPTVLCSSINNICNGWTIKRLTQEYLEIYQCPGQTLRYKRV